MCYPVLFIYTTDFLMLLIPHNTHEHNFLLLLDISSRYDLSLYIYVYISPCCQIFRLFSNFTIMNNVAKIMFVHESSHVYSQGIQDMQSEVQLDQKYKDYNAS